MKKYECFFGIWKECKHLDLLLTEFMRKNVEMNESNWRDECVNLLVCQGCINSDLTKELVKTRQYLKGVL